MTKKDLLDQDRCPLEKPFSKWYRAQIKRNMETLAQEGKAIRLGFFVTEEQINKKFKIARGEIKPGTVIEKLEQCGMKLVKIDRDDKIVVGFKGMLR